MYSLPNYFFIVYHYLFTIKISHPVILTLLFPQNLTTKQYYTYTKPMEEVYSLALLPYGIKFKQLQDKYNRRFGGTINDIFFDYEMIKDLFKQYSNTPTHFEFERSIYSQAITTLKDPTIPKKNEPFYNTCYHTGIYKEVILLIFKLNGARNSKINLLNCLLPKLKFYP